MNIEILIEILSLASFQLKYYLQIRYFRLLQVNDIFKFYSFIIIFNLLNFFYRLLSIKLYFLFSKIDDKNCKKKEECKSGGNGRKGRAK